MSRLLASGHTHVTRWPLARVWVEDDLCRERQAEDTRATALAMFQAGVGVQGGKKGVRAFFDWLKGLA